jgi:phage terminase large subunit
MFAFDYANEKIVDETIRWVDDEQGYIRIFEEPKAGYPYVIGGDTAGDGSDNFTGQVLNNVSGSQVATLCHQFDEDLYTRQMYCLGRYYNEALEGIEVNFSTYPVKELTRLGYYSQYAREVIDTNTQKRKQAFGFRTDKLSRPLIIANLVQIVREHPELINDILTLGEMLTFVRNEKGKAEAQDKKHDDLLIGLAIAYHIRPQQSMSLINPTAFLPGQGTKTKPRPFDAVELDPWDKPNLGGNFYDM